MAKQWIVLKFGGTSVAGRPQWDAVASLASARRSTGRRVLLVCSAVAGVTDRLTDLSQRPPIDSRLPELIDIHRALGAALEVDEPLWLPEAQELLGVCLERLAREDSPCHRADLLAIGEWLSTRIGALFLQQRMEAAWVDARDALEIIPEPDLSPARRWLSADCRAGADPELARRWSELPPVLVTQGFVARTPGGHTALLGRGGSDTSAALLSGRLEADALEIWTDVPGLFSADPRLLPDARLLSEVDYTEALEMAASGAKVVHPRCIRAAAETRTPVVICDMARPDVRGTRIGNHRSAYSGVKTVTCQHGMAVLLLQNVDARRQVGFLAGVFGVFAERGISVDLVATSETTTTVSLNCAANHLGRPELEQLCEALAPLCTVELFPDCVCVNLVGHGARLALSRLQGVMDYFRDHPLLMASQSANDLCLSLLVHAGDHEPLLHAVHSVLVPAADRGDAGESGVFGPSWRELGGNA